jgi:S-adenosylmethionine hydrolase
VPLIVTFLSTLLLYEDAPGALALAVNSGDAGSRLGVGPGDELRLTAP